MQLLTCYIVENEDELEDNRLHGLLSALTSIEVLDISCIDATSVRPIAIRPNPLAPPPTPQHTHSKRRKSWKVGWRCTCPPFRPASRGTGDRILKK